MVDSIILDKGVGGQEMHRRQRREHKTLPLTIDFVSRSSDNSMFAETPYQNQDQDHAHSTSALRFEIEQMPQWEWLVAAVYYAAWAWICATQ
jgi:hypothetical protein